MDHKTGSAIPIIRKSEEELSLLPDLDWARLAAFIDGEGCIRIRRQHGRSKTPGLFEYDLELTVVNTDPQLMKWLADTFGGTCYYSSPESFQPRRRQGYYWRCRCSQACFVLQRCMPFFIIKHEQADCAVMFHRLFQHYRKIGMVNARHRTSQWVGEFFHDWLSQQKKTVPELQAVMEKEITNAVQ